MRLQTKFFLVGKFLAVIPLVGMGLFLFAYLARFLRTMAVSQLHAEASSVAKTVASHPGSWTSLEELYDENRKIAVLVGQDGRYLYHPDQHRVGTAALKDFPAEAVRVSDQPRSFTVPGALGVSYPVVLLPGARRARVVEQVSLEAVYAPLRPLQREMLLYVAVTAVLACLLAIFMVRAVTKPIQTITQANLQVAASAGIQAVSMKMRHEFSDEIAELVHARGLMLHELSVSRDRVNRAERLALLGEMVGSVAHEIRNPLQVILLQTELCERQLKDPEQREAVRDILSAARRCKKIVSDMLEFVRPGDSVRTRVDLRAIVRAALHFREQSLRACGVTPRVVMEEDEAPVMADATQLEQVFINLINNAAEAMYAKNNGGALTLRTQVRGDRVFAEVVDDGPGIPKEHLHRLFGPFFTTKPTGQGTGLGLRVSSRIVKEHGGEIQVESTPGQGARFIVSLPTAAALSPGPPDGVPRENCPGSA